MPPIPFISAEFIAPTASQGGSGGRASSPAGSFAALLAAIGGRQGVGQQGALTAGIRGQSDLASLLTGQGNSLAATDQTIDLVDALAGIENLQVLQQILGFELDLVEGDGGARSASAPVAGTSMQQNLISAMLAELQATPVPVDTAAAALAQGPAAAGPATPDAPSQPVAGATLTQAKQPLTGATLTQANLESLFQEQSKQNLTAVQTTGSVSSASQTPADTSPATGPGEIKVESWTATFTPVTQPQRPAADADTEAFLKFQELNTAGQAAQSSRIKVYAPVDVDEFAVSQTSSPAAPKTDGSAIRQDVNGNYITSHLPGVEQEQEAADSGQQQGKQSESGNKSQLQAELGTRLDGARDQAATTFSLEQSQPVTSSGQINQPTTEASMLKLPSGAVVPEQRIVDQVVNQFTINRRLESGSVTLKLHPQELGELRLEIKVEQDNIKAHITTQNPQVQEILDRHLPRLREALGLQGLNLEQVEITVAANDNTDTQQSGSQHEQPRFTGPTRIVAEQEGFEDLLAEEQHNTGSPTLNLHI